MKKYDFSKDMQEVLSKAEEIALNYKHKYILPIHLFYALIDAKDEKITYWLKIHNIDTEKLMNNIKNYLAQIDESEDGNEIEVSESVRTILRTSGIVAVSSGEDEVSTLNLLMAILDEADEIIENIFSDLGLDISKLEDILYIEELKREYVDSQSVLMNYGINLNSLIEKENILSFTAKWTLTDKIIEILSRQIKNIPFLVGSLGVNKTVLVEGLAERIVNGNIPDLLKNFYIIHIMTDAVIANSKDINNFVEIMRDIISEAEQYSNIILYFDELYPDYYKTGTIDLLLLLKPALKRQKIKVIGCSSKKNVKNYLKQDEFLESKIELLKLQTVSENRAMEILKSYKFSLEKIHGTKIEKKIIEYAYNMVKKYIDSDKPLEYTINVLDMAATKKNLSSINKKSFVRKKEIDMVIADIIDIPVWRVSRDRRFYNKLDSLLAKDIVGQKEAIRKIVRVIQMKENHFNLNPNLPDGIFLFVGPRGVGKKKVISSLAKLLYNDEKRITYFNMNLFSTPESIYEFLGFKDPNKDIIYESILISAIKRYPYSILFLDEIDKASKEVQSLFAEIFKTGSFTDSFGNKVLFSGITVVMTVKAYQENKKQLGFVSEKNIYTYDEETVFNALNNMILADILTVVDETLIFKELTDEEMELIIEKNLIKSLNEKLNIKWSIDKTLLDFLRDTIRKEKDGLNSMKLIFQKYVFSYLAINFYAQNLKERKRIKLGYKNGKVIVI